MADGISAPAEECPAPPASVADKGAWRRWLRGRRNRLLADPGLKAAADAALLRRLREFLAKDGAFAALVAYLPLPDEPDIRPLLRQWCAAGKALLLPRFIQNAGAYELAPVAEIDRDTAPGYYGIPEPASPIPAATALPPGTLWLVPGTGFDASGARLGRGAGYYDRLLARYADGFRLGVAWDCQLIPQLPAEGHDVRMDAVLTEHRLLRRPGGLQIGNRKYDNTTYCDVTVSG